MHPALAAVAAAAPRALALLPRLHSPSVGGGVVGGRQGRRLDNAAELLLLPVHCVQIQGWNIKIILYS